MTEILENLKKAVGEYDSDRAAYWARKALEEKIDPILALDALTAAIRLIGDQFGQGELWLPDLIGASEAMSAASAVIEDEIQRTGAKRDSLGTVVIGTVQGDIHNIGKNMVATLLRAAGFQVHDLGVDVKAGAFLEAVRRFDADLLAMSALLTTTAPQQMKAIEALKEQDLRNKVKVMVGGGSITKEFANSIGADGYDPTAPGAVKLARSLVGK